MFRSISAVTKRKRNYFENKTKDDDAVDGILAEFFDSFFSKQKDLLKREITTNTSGNNLIIICSNKIIANELLMKSRELLAMLKEKNRVFDKIIIK